MMRVNAFKKFVGAAAAAVVLCAGMFIVGCSDDDDPVKPDDTPSVIPDSEFTIADFENANLADVIFSKYGAVLLDRMAYGMVWDFGEPTDFQQTVTVVKGEHHPNVYWDSPSPKMFSWSIEDGAVYFFEDDGEFGKGVWGRYAFFGDGAFEESFLPATRYITYAPDDGEEIVSVETRNGVRYVTIHAKLSDFFDPQWDLGLDDCDDCINETVYELDPVTNLLLAYSDYYIVEEGSEPRLIGRGTFTYGAANEFPLPEYVRKNKDMSETRTVRFVLNVDIGGEREFTFTLPKDALLVPSLMGGYELFEDAEYTVPHDLFAQSEHPDETTIYIRVLEEDLSLERFVLENSKNPNNIRRVRP